MNDDSSYIIGENNLGKSNFLSLLETICNGKNFDEADFMDYSRPIEVLLKLRLMPGEKSFLCSSNLENNNDLLILKITQDYQESISIVNNSTNDSIKAKLLRNIHYIQYNTTLNPSKELRFDDKGGAKLFFSYAIKSFINNKSKPDFFDTKNINKLIYFINQYLQRIRYFKNYSIGVKNVQSVELLSKAFYFSDGTNKLDEVGSGIQYLAMASINILCQIIAIFNKKNFSIAEHSYQCDGKTYFPLILAIDEPESHLHPFLQRSLIQYYKRILKNEDSDFLTLLKECFNIEKLIGQLIIVTHSTDVIVGDYKNLIRFYSDENKTDVICGKDINLSLSEEKHIIMRFPELKETFYSHCVLFVEGATEYGCIGIFANIMNINLDDYGVCIINAEGEKSIQPIRVLLKKFKIPSVAIYDNDVSKNKNYDNDTTFYTDELCFESEIVKSLYYKGKFDLLKKLVIEFEDVKSEFQFESKHIQKWYRKLKLDLNNFKPIKMNDIPKDDEVLFCNIFTGWLYYNKSVIMGRMIGELFKSNVDLIPNCYKTVINKATQLVALKK